MNVTGSVCHGFTTGSSTGDGVLKAAGRYSGGPATITKAGGASIFLRKAGDRRKRTCSSLTGYSLLRLCSEIAKRRTEKTGTPGTAPKWRRHRNGPGRRARGARSIRGELHRVLIVHEFPQRYWVPKIIIRRRFLRSTVVSISAFHALVTRTTRVRTPARELFFCGLKRNHEMKEPEVPENGFSPLIPV